MHPELADRRDTLVDLCRRFGVARLEVFGSAARGRDFDPRRSDADFLVAFAPAARDAVVFVATIDEAACMGSRLRQNAVIRSLEVLGEAANRVSSGAA